MKTHHNKALLQKWMRPGQLENQYSHWTTALASKWFWILLFGLTLLHFWMAYALPPVDDELYYWNWAQSLQLSYFDHPPMVAYWIAFSQSIFGKSVLALRLPAIFSTTLVLTVLAFLSGYPFLLGISLLTPLFLFGSVVITPDIPLVFFWTLYFWCFCQMNRELIHWADDPMLRVYRRSPISLWSWGLAGLILGLGILSKYTMALAVPCSFLALASRYRFRGWMLGFCFHLVIAGILSLPIFFYNLKLDFQPLLFQWHHSLGDSALSIVRALNFWGTQFLLIGVLPFFLLPVVLIKLREYSSNAVLHVAAWFFLCPLFFFLYKSLTAPLEANWALVTYLAFWPLACQIQAQTSFRNQIRVLTFLGFLPALMASLLLLFHWVRPLGWISEEKDRLRELKARYELSKQVVQDAKELNVPVFTPTYQWTSYLRYGGLETYQLAGEGRPSHFSIERKDPCQYSEILYFTIHPKDFNCFDKPTEYRVYSFKIGGTPIQTLALFKYVKKTPTTSP